MLVPVKGETVVEVSMQEVLQQWKDGFLSRLPLPDAIEEISIDPKSGKAVASWNIGSTEDPEIHTGRIHVSCKEVVIYEIVSNLLEIMDLPDSDKKFIKELGLDEENSDSVEQPLPIESGTQS